MAVSHRQMSLEAFLALPEEKPALEFEDGVVLQKVTPKPRHGFIQSAIARLIDTYAIERRLARTGSEIRFNTGGRSYVPDVSVYRWDRLPVDEAGDVSDDFAEPPDIAFEIVSPGQAVTALVRRCIWYTQHGVRIALLVDPAERSIIAFRSDQPAQALHGSDPIDLSEVLPGFELSVDQVMRAMSLK